MSSTQRRALPDGWVERIFRKLGLRYGRDFLGRYEGLDIADVMAEWSEELARFGTRPGAIQHALDHSPVKAPSLPEFAKLCGEYRGDQARVTSLPPPVDPAGLKRMAEAIRPLTQRVGMPTMLERLAEFEARAASGERLSAAQRDWVKTVRAKVGATGGQEGQSLPVSLIPDEVLPPGMRAGANGAAQPHSLGASQ